MAFDLLPAQAGDIKRQLGDSAGAAILENIRVWALILSGRVTEAFNLADLPRFLGVDG